MSDLGVSKSVSKWFSHISTLQPTFASVPHAANTGSHSRKGIAMHDASKTDTRPNADRPEVWVGCIGCRNAGRLVGDWFDANDCPVDMAEFEQATTAFLPWVHFGEGHEELWVFDHQGFAGVLTGECSPTEAQRLAVLIEQAEDRGLPTEALAHWLNDGHHADDADELLDGLQDAYRGHWDSGADYAQELAEEIGALPQDVAWPVTCINWDHAWREQELGGDNWAIRAADGGYLIFRAV